MPAKKKNARKPARPKRAKRAAPRTRASQARKQPETLRLRTCTAGLTVNDIHKSVA